MKLYFNTVVVIFVVLTFTFFVKWLLWIYLFNWKDPYETNIAVLLLFCAANSFLVPIMNEKFLEIDIKKDLDAALENLFVRVAILISYISLIYFLGNQLGFFENIFTGSISLIALVVVAKDHSEGRGWIKSCIQVKALFWGGFFSLMRKILSEINPKKK